MRGWALSHCGTSQGLATMQVVAGAAAELPHLPYVCVWQLLWPEQLPPVRRATVCNTSVRYRSWLERQQSCPTCRTSVMQDTEQQPRPRQAALRARRAPRDPAGEQPGAAPQPAAHQVRSQGMVCCSSTLLHHTRKTFYSCSVVEPQALCASLC